MPERTDDLPTPGSDTKIHVTSSPIALMMDLASSMETIGVKLILLIAFSS
jgi:hypothetical protein